VGAVMRSTYSKNEAKRATQTRRVWTDREVRTLCALYQSMLDAQRDGRKFVKAPAVRAVADELQRSKGSIEAKLMNLSACLRDLGREFVTGYKPLPSYAKTMIQIVESEVL
jgi:hypothetical protein